VIDLDLGGLFASLPSSWPPVANTSWIGLATADYTCAVATGKFATLPRVTGLGGRPCSSRANSSHVRPPASLIGGSAAKPGGEERLTILAVFSDSRRFLRFWWPSSWLCWRSC